MARPITVVPHLSLEEVELRMRSASSGLEHAHWQVVWLAMRGKPSKEIVDVTGYGRDWVFVLLKRYNERGPDALGDGRASNGAAPMLSEEDQADLAEALKGEAPDGGLWTSVKVARWMSERLQREVSPQRGWDYLQRLGFSLKVPRPHHAKADDRAQEAFKKGASKLRSNGSNENIQMQVLKPGPKTKRVWA